MSFFMIVICYITNVFPLQTFYSGDIDLNHSCASAPWSNSPGARSAGAHSLEATHQPLITTAEQCPVMCKTSCLHWPSLPRYCHRKEAELTTQQIKLAVLGKGGCSKKSWET